MCEKKNCAKMHTYYLATVANYLYAQHFFYAKLYTVHSRFILKFFYTTVRTRCAQIEDSSFAAFIEKEEKIH